MHKQIGRDANCRWWHSRFDEENHDHIGSATPSGVVTPNPNPTDKRLPGIIHGYFGQVGATCFLVVATHPLLCLLRKRIP